MNSKLEIRDDSKYGRGVFTKEDIEKDEVLIVMGGHIFDTDLENEVGEFATNYNMDISEEFSFCPKEESDLMKMPQHLVNHSCDPNAGFSEQCFMVAIKDISAGDEIVYDYAFVMFSSDDSESHFEMECGCGSENCRKIIREDDWKLPEIQKNYLQYFQPFLRKKIINK